MKKPDKIYVHRGLHLGMLTTTVNKVDAPDEEEYIRKDALIEWIQEVRAISHENAIVRDLTFQEVVNKLNSL